MIVLGVKDRLSQNTLIPGVFGAFSKELLDCLTILGVGIH
jgi:hypothetical protein